MLELAWQASRMTRAAPFRFQVPNVRIPTAPDYLDVLNFLNFRIA